MIAQTGSAHNSTPITLGPTNLVHNTIKFKIKNGRQNGSADNLALNNPGTLVNRTYININ